MRDMAMEDMANETPQDDEPWLETAVYGDEPVHRLRKAPIVAAIAAAVTLALVMALPRAWVERAVYELYIDSVIPAARLPLGDMAHAAFALVAAALIALVVFAVMRFVDFGKLLRGGRASVARGDADADADADADISPRLRRFDRHPDAPSRAPFMAGSDISEDYGEASGDDEIPHRDANVASETDAEEREAIAEPVMPQAGNDDDTFDLGGFEVGEGDDVDDLGEEAQAGPASGVFDVANIGDPEQADDYVAARYDEDADDAAPEIDLVVPSNAGDGPLGDVRSRFAELFDPGEGVDETVERESRDLSGLSTSELIDELERRIGARSAKSDDEAATRTASDDDADTAPIAHAEEAEAGPPPLLEGQVGEPANEDIAADFDDMDAALQAALGTLARMQQRSAG